MQQTTPVILMIEPTHFAFNSVASVSNSFQNQPINSEQETRQAAITEFHKAVDQLRSLDVEVLVYKGESDNLVPDAVFPNNWISTHPSGELLLYPMAVSNRRSERRLDIIHDLIQRSSYHLFDYSNFESGPEPQYLEGTGSLIFDHKSKVVYAAISPRTHEELVIKIAERLGYQPVCFKAYGKSGELIYHTNVMMCVGESFIIIGDETIDIKDKKRVLDTAINSGKEIILLNNEQVYHHFAGNMLQISNKAGNKLLVMSTTARNSLTEQQIEKLERHNAQLVPFDIPTIEFVGGGSARCMLAEIYSVDDKN